MAQDNSTPKIGAGHASAMFRQGLSELRAALYPDSNVAQPPQYGLYGTKTPGEVAESRRAAELDQERVVAGGEQPNRAGADLERNARADAVSRQPPEIDRG